MEGLGDLDGKVIGGRYTLSHKLGQGGMGAVYAATQTSLGRRVAIKVLLPILSGDQGLIARFKSEAERAGRLNHPNIVQVLDFGRESDGTVWIAMELLEGEALTDRIERGALSEADVVAIAKSTLAGLEAAHGDHLVHRDLKPDNIFLAKTPGVGDVVKILDFGIAKLLDGDSAAKLTATGLVIGTPLYMSPEQARGEDLDRRSDLYSLGAVMYEALTGTPPFTGRNYNALLVAVLTNTPRPIQEVRPGISPELADVVMRALSKEPAHRFANASEMSAALSTFIPSTTAPALPSGQDLGLASTMATPQIGSVTPVNVTPVHGGIGTPVPTRTSDAASARAAAVNADTAPMTEPATPPKKRTRSHGWLVAMAFVALLAGVGGTYTLMMNAGDADQDPLAMADGPAAQVEAVAGPAPAPPPVVPIEPGAAPGAPGGPTGATELRVRGGPDDPEPPADDDGDDREGSASPMTERAQRPRGPAATIRPSGGSFARHREHSQHGFRDHANWSSCWPRNMPFPEHSWGLNIDARTNPDGTLTNLRPGGSNLYPPVAECLIRLMAGATLGPSDDGQGHDVSLGFTFYPTRPQRRR